MSVFIDNATNVTTITILSATGIFLPSDAYKIRQHLQRGVLLFFFFFNEKKEWVSINGDLRIF